MANPAILFASQNPVELPLIRPPETDWQAPDSAQAWQALAEADALQRLRQVVPERSGSLATANTILLPTMGDLPRREPQPGGGDIEKTVEKDKGKGSGGGSGNGDSGKKKDS